MRTKNFLKHLILGVLILVTCKVLGQATTPGNVAAGTNDFLGWNATSPANDFPLMIKHEANQPIDLYTNDIHRFRLLPDATYVVNPNLPAKVADGWALLCPDVAGFLSLGAPGPFSLLHLADGQNAFMTSDRAWMNIGITFTGNRDMGYIGQKAYGMDRTDMVFHWSDDPGEAAADRARFLFTSGYNASAPTGATSAEGLEGMRLFVEDDDNINVGIGDWFAANFNDPTITEPDERLDIVDGNVRIRALPGTSAANTENRYMVVDANGVVRWRDLPAGAGCEWNLVGNNPVTAYFNNQCPPGETNRVGIGTNNPQAKLQVLATASSNSTTALRVDQQSLSGTTLGLDVKNNDPSTGHNSGTGYGVRSIVRNAATMNGVRGEAFVTATEGASEVWGVFGFGQSGANTTTAKLGGIYGGATAGGSTTTELLGGRLVVQMNSGTSHNTVRGLDVKVAPQASSTSANTWGGRFESEGTSSTSATYGVESLANAAGGTRSFGIHASGYNASQMNYGVHASASGSGVTNYGIHASATGGTTNWAGYFVGNVHATGVVTWASDESLKTNIEAIENAMDLISALQPKRYDFHAEQLPQLGLPSGKHYGMLAQQVQEVLPELIVPVTHPEAYDEETGVLHPAVDYLSLNYVELIPLLIAGIQEQSVRMDALEQALAACCAPSDDGSLMQAPLDSEGKPKIDPALERLMRIDPNPFTDATTVRYTLERAGRVQLLVNSSDGKQLQVLHEGLASAGDHSYDWNTGHLAPGMYYVTLLLDGEPLVKRAVKVR